MIFGLSPRFALQRLLRSCCSLQHQLQKLLQLLQLQVQPLQLLVQLQLLVLQVRRNGELAIVLLR